jgi:ankyrin repeat protein
MEICRLLIDKGRCDANSVSMSAMPALHVAVFSSSIYSLQLVELLVSRGADVNKRDGSDGGGYTVLDIAAKKKKKVVYEFLESCGAKHSLRFGAETGSANIINNYLLRSPMPRKEDIWVCLALASAIGEVTSVKTIIQSEAININEAVVRGDITPLHLAACRGHYSICKFLIDSGINVAARAHGGVDIHIYSSTISGAPLWFNPAQEGPGGSLLPPPVRVKTAAELAREAGHNRLGKLLDLSMVETVIAKREDSIDSVVSWRSSSPLASSPSRPSSPSPPR